MDACVHHCDATPVCASAVCECGAYAYGVCVCSGHQLGPRGGVTGDRERRQHAVHMGCVPGGEVFHTLEVPGSFDGERLLGVRLQLLGSAVLQLLVLLLLFCTCSCLAPLWLLAFQWGVWGINRD